MNKFPSLLKNNWKPWSTINRSAYWQKFKRIKNRSTRYIIATVGWTNLNSSKYIPVPMSAAACGIMSSSSSKGRSPLSICPSMLATVFCKEKFLKSVMKVSSGTATSSAMFDFVLRGRDLQKQKVQNYNNNLFSSSENLARVLQLRYKQDLYTVRLVVEFFNYFFFRKEISHRSLTLQKLDVWFWTVLDFDWWTEVEFDWSF